MNEAAAAPSWITVSIPGGSVVLGNAQHQGARPYQEDSFGFSDISPHVTESKGILAVVADGMGGLANGKEVSSTIVTAMLEFFNSDQSVCRSGEDLKKAAAAFNERICDTYCKSGKVEAGSTLVAALVNNGYLHWLCIGDSRLYLKRRGRMYQINEDHDFLNQLLDDVVQGRRSYASADSDPQKDSLVGCIGKRELDSYDYSKRGYRLMDGDSLVLCSDGVYNALTPEEFSQSITEDAMGSCENIIRLVYSKHYQNQDNNTVVIMSYHEKGLLS